MSSSTLDPYRPGDSLAHRLDARVKVGLAMGFILAVAFTPHGAWPVLLILTSLALVAAIFAELRVGFVLARTAVALPFVLAALPLLFTIAGRPLFALPWGWIATHEGLARLTSVVLKAWLSVLSALILTATTPFNAILVTLRGWGLPRVLVSIVALTWRYLFVLVAEAQRLMRARASRSGRAEGKRGDSLIWRAHVTGGMAGSLLLRGMDRADRIYGAMVARGYDGEPRMLVHPPLAVPGRAFLVMGLVTLALLALAGLFFWG
jgi:cobalt/nickel transport system permease protein